MMASLVRCPTIGSVDPTDFNGILLAAPKKRRTLERRRLRTFGLIKRMENALPKENIVTCPKCNNWHEAHTICGMFILSLKSFNFDYVCAGFCPVYICEDNKEVLYISRPLLR